MNSRYRAITFDAGGTLISPWPSVGHIYAEIAESFGIKTLDRKSLDREFLNAWKARTNFDYSIEEWEKLVNQTFLASTGSPISRQIFRALYRGFEEPTCWRVHPEVMELLPILKNHFKLGVISNWDDRLRPLFLKLGLAGFFEAIVISCEAGITKPSPVIFRQAAEFLNCSPELILHVGDSQKEDFEGAKGAGFQAFLFEDGKFDKKEFLKFVGLST